MRKRILSLSLVLCLCLALLSLSASADSSGAQTMPTDTSASDAPSTWAAEQVNAAIAARLVPGNLQSEYKQATTRAEFCALAVALYENVTGSEITERTEFSDTDDVNVQKAAAIGVVDGVGDNRFSPGSGLTREQAATMLSRLADAAGNPLDGSEPTFTDSADIETWAADAVGQVQAAGIMSGVGGNAFSPTGDYTREQSIITIMRLYAIIENTAGRTAVQREGFKDIPITVGEGTEYPLAGILSMPDEADGEAGGLVPAVVLVHGSGPQDMDETIFENKPFKDIADHLASNGVAVIRYDKRTFKHGAKMAEELGGSITVREETVEDALSAAELLRAAPGIDKNRIFLLGHSLGGMLAPRICAEDGGFAGLISLAGSPRSLLDIIYDQNMAAIEAMPEGAEKTLALVQIRTYDAQVAVLKALSDAEAKAVPVFGASYYYFKEMDEHPAADSLEDIEIPILIMQGGADLQVYADKDYVLWQELLEGRENATFHLYDGLNHLFMPSRGATIAGLMEEYAIPGHVDGQVLSDITAWITASKYLTPNT